MTLNAFLNILYLGHIIKTSKENEIAEIKRRIQLSWVMFGKLSFKLCNKDVPICLKRKAYARCILPVIRTDWKEWSWKKSCWTSYCILKCDEKSNVGNHTKRQTRFFFFVIIWHYKPGWVLAYSMIPRHLIRSCAFLLRPLISIVFASFSTSSIHLVLGLSLFLAPLKQSWIHHTDHVSEPCQFYTYRPFPWAGQDYGSFVLSTIRLAPVPDRVFFA